MYRAQNLMFAPEGFRAETYVYPILSTDVNGGSAIAAGKEIQNIPIQIDKDYDFYLCGMAYAAPFNFNLLGFRLRDAWNSYLSDDYCLTILYAYPAGVNSDKGAGFAPVFEPPLLCPKGSTIQLDVKNFSALTAYAWQNLELRGYKTVRGCD